MGRNGILTDKSKIVSLKPGIYLLEEKVPVSGIIECVCTFGNIMEREHNGSLTLVIVRHDSEFKSWNYINKVFIPQNVKDIKQNCKSSFNAENRKVLQNDGIGIYIPENGTYPLQIALAVAKNNKSYKYVLGSSSIPDLLNGGVSWMTSNGSYEFNLRIKIKGNLP